MKALTRLDEGVSVNTKMNLRGLVRCSPRLWLGAVTVSLLGPISVTVTAANAAGHPFLQTLFTDHVVLQRNRPIPIWGWTKPGASVTVELDGKVALAMAGLDGKWIARLPEMPAGGPYEIAVKGPETVILHDVLIGDVWICSGQSNMEMGIKNVNDADQEVTKAKYPQIRLFTVPQQVSAHPVDTLSSQWLVCTPENITKGVWGGFSAVGYFFGRALHEDLQVPIGLIHTSWGGTIAEAWTSGDKLLGNPEFSQAVNQLRDLDSNNGPEAHAGRVAKWWTENDPGSLGETWAAVSTNATPIDAVWKTMKLPTHWENAGLPDFDGVVWFRKEIVLPADWEGKEAMLHLGPIDDMDTSYVNGQAVGSMGAANEERHYKIPAGLLKGGTNVVAVRVLDTAGAGGIYGQADQLKLERAGNSDGAISLAGEWKYFPSVSLAQARPFPKAFDGNPNVVTVLYNGMIAPLVPYGIRGAIWYQGESNADRARQYQSLLPMLIEDWRDRFESGRFPFFIVQLANFMEAHPEPTESAWAELREAQFNVAKVAAPAGIASAIDIGDAGDIHPKNKQEVGRRLSLAARAIAYGESIPYSGPTFKAFGISDYGITVAFDHLDGGLEVKGGGKLKGFAIAGTDKKFVWADARIDGDTVVVSSPSVTKPAYVRYDWADNPDGNLYNKAGLPAFPFRTDLP